MGFSYSAKGTWLFYAVLVDLGDAVASELSLPFDRISLEMIDRGLDHFYVAHQKVRQLTQLSISLHQKIRI